MKEILHIISRRYFSKGAAPYWVVLTMDCLILLCAGFFSRIMMRGLLDTAGSFWSVFATLCCYLPLFMIGFRWMHTYSGVIRYSSFVDLMRIVVANFTGVVLVFAVRHLCPIDSWLQAISWQELLIMFVLATSIMWAIRILVKYLYDVLYISKNAQRVFIYGTKEGGIALAKAARNQESQYVVSGFVSDEPKDWSHLLMGAKIYPNDDNLVSKMRQKGANILMVSPLKTKEVRNRQEMVDSLTKAKIKILLYSQHEEWDGKSDLQHNQLKEVDIEDLLPRNEIHIDLNSIAQVLSGKCVMITGAAGSIGSEIARQVAEFKPSQLVLIDQAETPLHDIRIMMARKYPSLPCLTLTASINHRNHMESVFKEYKPEYVFHAAAYKHVPMMEDNPGEAVINNVEGTRIIADLSVKYGASKFVMVSTDKAVNPTNVMGCSKRICEMYCQSLSKAIADGRMTGKTQFVTTRFGNVLGSNGSVIPIFKEQIKNGGPITVTHPDIIRYFMLIPEACNLVLQAGAMGHGGEIYVFDMGNPVRIADLAKRMILLSGATDVKIEYTGLRDGEKLFEELLTSEENTMPSSHPKIKLATVRELGYDEVNAQVDELMRITMNDYNDMAIVKQMKLIVPEFKSQNSKYESLD